MSESIISAPCLVGEFSPVTEITVPIAGVERYDRAVAVAAKLAERWDIPVRIVHVRVADDPVDFDALEAIRAAFSHGHPGVPVAATLIAHDDIAAATEAVAPPTALVVMSSEHARRGPSSSMAEQILETIGLAMILGPQADAEHVFGPVTVALDGSPTAESIDAPMEMVQIVGPATAKHVQSLRARGERVSESGYLRSVAERLAADGASVGWEVVHDDEPVDGLLRTVRGSGGGPIVVGSHGRSEVAHRMLGSTAMGLVADHAYPVLVVRTRRRPPPELGDT